MRKLLEKAVEGLEKAGCETPQLDAEVLLAHALGCERHELFTTPLKEARVPYGKLELFQSYIERRKKREPVAYIRGFKEFWSIKIKVTPDVLIPRPETETLVGRALEKVSRLSSLVSRPSILDLCTGSGCITAALAKEIPTAQFTVTDISEKALAVAKENLRFAKDRIQFIQSDLFEKIEGQFDLIVSNPPYIPTAQLETLMPEIKEYEPRLALDGGPEGLDFVSKILQDVLRFLNPNGWLILENGAEIQTWNVSSLRGEQNLKERFRSTEPKTLSSL